MTLVDPDPAVADSAQHGLSRHWRALREHPVFQHRAFRYCRTVVAWLVVVPLVLFTVLRLTGFGRVDVFIQLLAFTAYALPVGLLVTIGTGLLHRWVPFALALAATVALAVVVLPRGFGGAQPDWGGPHLRIVSANMEYGSADPDNLVKLVRENNADLLALQEYTPGAQRRLRAAGLENLLPYQAMYPSPNPDGSAIYSRYPLTDTGYLHVSQVFGQAYGLMHLPTGQVVHVESAHPPAPAAPNTAAQWRAGQEIQPKARDYAGPQILVGDFNATLDHAPLRALVRTGYTDVASKLGDGLAPTWPYDGTPVPPVTLDHILIAGLRAYAFRTYPNPGSDHRATYAEVGLPRG